MPHLSELHGAATHLAVIAIPLYALIVMLQRFGPDHPTLRHIEPWVLGATLASIASASATGLLVWGQAQQQLRGQAFRIGTAHFWLGIALAAAILAIAGARYRASRNHRLNHARVFVAAAAIAMAMVFVQGYIGGRMTYDQGVGIQDGGQFAQTANGATLMAVDRAKGMTAAEVGKAGFSARGLGCARCHGDLAQGLRGPDLAGRDLEPAAFRRVHGHGLFPSQVVTDADVAALSAWLRTVPGRPGRRGDDG